MKAANRRWRTWSLGLLAVIALTGWRSSAELLMITEGAACRAPSTELEYRKTSSPVDEGSNPSSTSAVGGGLIVLLSIGMVRSAKAKNRRPRTDAQCAAQEPSKDLTNTAAPLPEEFQALITELDEMIASFKDAA